MAIPVIIISSSEDKKNIENIKYLFSSKLFKIYYYNTKEKNDIILSLEYSKEIPEKDSPVILIRDTSISDLTPEIIEKKVKSSLEYLTDETLIFLCKWQDNFQKYSIINPNEFGSKLKKSFGTVSDQCILFSPKIRDKFIKSENSKTMSFNIYMYYLYENTNIKTYVFDPNLINYDSSYATSIEDYSKTNSYSDKKPEKKKENTTYNLILFFFICFIIFLISYSLININ